MTENKEAIDSLEALVDANGLSNVVDFLATIAREKAQHIRENWQDANLARDWDKAANKIDLCATALRRFDVPGI